MLGGGAADAAQFSETAGGRPPPPVSEELENCTKAKLTGNSSHSRFGAGELTVKIVRANGGCLGTRSRRRTWTAAISRGEALNSL